MIRSKVTEPQTAMSEKKSLSASERITTSVLFDRTRPTATAKNWPAGSSSRFNVG
ncbi:UNVERIFIED_ORG: hypothetical protein GGD51_000567 [Rhizobium esperanzae]